MGRICPTCQSTNKHQKQEHAVHNFSQPPFFELRSTLEIHWLKNKNRSVLPLPRTDHLCGLQAQPPSLLSYSLNYLKGTFSLNPLRTPQINIPHQQSSPPLLYSPPSPSEEPHHSLQHTAGGGGHTPSLPSPPHPGGTAVKDEGDTHTYTDTEFGALYPAERGRICPFPRLPTRDALPSSPHGGPRDAGSAARLCLPSPAPCLLLPALPAAARSLPVPCLFPACRCRQVSARTQERSHRLPPHPRLPSSIPLPSPAGWPRGG